MSFSFNLKWILLTKSIGATTAVASSITIGGILGMDAIYERFMGESAITKFGKWTGFHKDSPYRRKLK